MPIDLKNRPDEDSDIRPEWFKPGADPLEESYGAPSASDDNLPVGHPSRNDLGALGGEELAAAESSRKGLYNPEKSGKHSDEANQLEGLYSGAEKKRRISLSGTLGNISGRKKALSLIAGGGIVGAIFGLYGMFSTLSLDIFVKNVEAKSFVRFQVDMEGRSSKWVNAYICLRLMEITDPDLAPEDRDNLIFRANRVDTNHPMSDWYRTMRASKFEQEVFEKNGIRFASAAYRDENGRMQFRPAIISVNNEQIRFSLNEEERAALNDAVDNNNFDVNKFNGRLRDMVDTQVLNSDKEGRRAIRNIVNENTKPWQYAKRYYTRKAIQNMTGVRDWRMFEKTRDKLHQKNVDMRTKFVKKAMPESTKSGKFVQCLFGILPDSDCKASTDPNDPANHSEPEGTSDDISSDSEEDNKKGLSSKILTSAVSKLSGAFAGVAIFDQLNKIDGQVKNGSLSEGVYTMRNAQAIGAFTAMGIAASQVHTGELTTEELNEFMQIFSYAGTSEGWQTVIAKNGNSGTPEGREKYCSDEHQEFIKLPENRKAAEQEYHYICDSQKVGASTNAAAFEGAWNNSVGYVIGPLGSVFDSVGGGWFMDKFNSTISAVTGPVTNALLSGFGLDDNLEDGVQWVVKKVAQFAGAVPLIDEDSPGGVYLNHVIQGGAGAAEASSRLAGGSLATETSMYESETRIAIYLDDKKRNETFYEKYLSTDNTESVLATAITATSGQSKQNMATTMFSTLWNMPLSFGFNAKSKADTTTGREVANLGGTKMYDIPTVCTDSNPLDSLKLDALPSMTNADDIGLIKQSDLTWELLSDSAEFYGKLYADNPDKGKEIETVYNCAVFDAVARGATAGKYAPDFAGTNAIEDASANTSSVSGSGGDLRLSSFNIFYSTGGKAHLGSWQSRLSKSVRVIKTNDFQVVGLQEVRKNQYDRLKDADMLGNEYGFCPDPYGNDYAAQNPIIWLKSEVELVDCKTIEGYQVLGPVSKANTQVKLRLKSSQQIFYVINHHEPVGNANIKERFDSANKRAAYVKDLSKEGFPIILTGDFNSKMGFEDNQRTYQNDKNNSPYCILTDNLLRHAYDVEKSKSGKCPSWGTKGTGVDHIFMSPGLEVSRYSYDKITKPSNGSDAHNTAFADIKFPGSESSSSVGAGGFAWPLDKKYWDKNRSDFLDQHGMSSGTFTSPNQKGVAVDISSPPKGSAIYSMVDGVVEKTNLCGKGDGMIIRSNISGGVLRIAYGHATNPKVRVGDKVTAGQQILSLDGAGCQTTGPHLHMDMSFNDKHFCPQDVFRAMGDNKTVNFTDLVKNMRAPCN